MNLHAPVILLRSEDLNYITPNLDFNKRVPSDYYLFDLCQRGESLGRNIQVRKDPLDKLNIEMAKYIRDDSFTKKIKSQNSKKTKESDESVDKIGNFLKEQYAFPLSKKKYNIFMPEVNRKKEESCRALHSDKSYEEPMDFNTAITRSSKYLKSMKKIKDLNEIIQKKPTIIYYGDTRPLSKRTLTKLETPQHNIHIYSNAESDSKIEPLKPVPYDDAYLDWNGFFNYIYKRNLNSEKKSTIRNALSSIKTQAVQNNISKCKTITKLARKFKKNNLEKEFTSSSSSIKRFAPKEIEDINRIKEVVDQNRKNFKKYTSEINLNMHLESQVAMEDITSFEVQPISNQNQEIREPAKNLKITKEGDKSNSLRLSMKKILSIPEKNPTEIDETKESTEMSKDFCNPNEKVRNNYNNCETPKTSLEMKEYLKKLSKYNKRFMFQKYSDNAINLIKKGLNIYAHNSNELKNLLNAENFSKKLYLENQNYRHEILDRIEEENVKACVKYGEHYVKAKMKEFHNISKENSKVILDECKNNLKENNINALNKIYRKTLLLSQKIDRESQPRKKIVSTDSFVCLSRLDKYISKNFYSKWKQMKLLKLR